MAILNVLLRKSYCVSVKGYVCITLCVRSSDGRWERRRLSPAVATLVTGISFKFSNRPTLAACSSHNLKAFVEFIKFVLTLISNNIYLYNKPIFHMQNIFFCVDSIVYSIFLLVGHKIVSIRYILVTR